LGSARKGKIFGLTVFAEAARQATYWLTKAQLQGQKEGPAPGESNWGKTFAAREKKRRTSGHEKDWLKKEMC